MLANDDIILTCSDGLCDVVSDFEIYETINNADNLSDAADELIRMAIDQGSKDNITVQLIQKLETEEGAEDTNTIITKPKEGLVTKIKGMFSDKQGN